MDGDKLRSLSRSSRASKLFHFEPWDYQAEVLDAPENADNGKTQATFVTGRQTGKTTCSSLIPADYALTHAGEDCLIASRFQSTSDELFRECMNHLSNVPLSDEEIGLVRTTRRTAEFDTGARILSRTLGTDGAQARGLSPACIVLDEAALLSSDLVETVVLPMLASHSTYQIYLVSTPLSRTGFLWEKHENDDSWQSFHVPTSASPLVDDEWIAARKSETDSITFDREYRGIFVDGGGESYLPREIVIPNVIDDRPKLGGNLFLGVDIAHAGSDRSWYLSVDSQGRVRVEAVIDKETVPEAVERIRRLNDQYRYSGIAVDATGGLGAAVDDYTTDLPNISPVKFTSRTKATMYQRLKRLCESGDELTLPNNERLIHELTSLTYDFTSTGILQVEAPDSSHDDGPDALCLALEARDGGERQEPHPATSLSPVLGTVREQPQPSLESLTRQSRNGRRH